MSSSQKGIELFIQSMILKLARIIRVTEHFLQEYTFGSKGFLSSVHICSAIVVQSFIGFVSSKVVATAKSITQRRYFELNIK